MLTHFAGQGKPESIQPHVNIGAPLGTSPVDQITNPVFLDQFHLRVYHGYA